MDRLKFYQNKPFGIKRVSMVIFLILCIIQSNEIAVISLWSFSSGCLGTAGALIYGLSAFRRGKTRQSQLLMRARIFAQGFTVVAIIVGVAATALKPKQ